MLQLEKLQKHGNETHKKELVKNTHLKPNVVALTSEKAGVG